MFGLDVAHHDRRGVALLPADGAEPAAGAQAAHQAPGIATAANTPWLDFCDRNQEKKREDCPVERIYQEKKLPSMSPEYS